MPRQPREDTSREPRTGTAAGAMPLMMPIQLNAFAAVTPLVMSGMTERARTTQAPDPSPWRKRAAMRMPMFGAMAHSRDVMRARAAPPTMKRFRPKVSESTPMMSWPVAMPIMNPLRVSWALVVARSRPSCGSPGRYMSIENGPAAESRARPARRPPVSVIGFSDIAGVIVPWGVEKL